MEKGRQEMQRKAMGRRREEKKQGKKQGRERSL
jgi:hypothetical protein